MNILSVSNLLVAQDWYVWLLIVVIVALVLFSVIAVVAIKPSKKKQENNSEQAKASQNDSEETHEELNNVVSEEPVAQKEPLDQPSSEIVEEDPVVEAQPAVEVASETAEETEEPVIEETVEEQQETLDEAVIEEESVVVEEPVVEEAVEEQSVVAESVVEEPAVEKAVEEEPEMEEPEYKDFDQLLSKEQILSAAEDLPEDEAPEYEILPEEDEPLEEVRSVNKMTGMAIIVRYKKSFTAKLIQTDDNAKAYYSMLKNALLSYQKVKNRISWNHENFNHGRNNIARFSIRGKTLCIYFALNASDYEDTKYKVEHAESKKYENISCMYRIKNARRAKYALDLIAALAEKFGLEKGEEQSVNYYLPYEPIQPLVERGLIKELVSEEDYNEFMRQYSRKEVDRKRREFISAKEVNEVISDDVAIALVQEKLAKTSTVSVKVKSVGKKGIINVDTLSENYENGETVNLENLKEKGLIATNVGTVKVLARGTLTKPLTVEAHDFSIEAIKMIVLTGGQATKV